VLGAIPPEKIALGNFIEFGHIETDERLVVGEVAGGGVVNPDAGIVENAVDAFFLRAGEAADNGGESEAQALAIEQRLHFVGKWHEPTLSRRIKGGTAVRL